MIDDDLQIENKQPLAQKISKKKQVIFLFLLGICLIYVNLTGSLFYFDKPRVVEVRRGESLKEIAEDLDGQDVVTSASFLSLLVQIMNGETHIVSGAYSFERKEGALSVAKRLIEGRTNLKSRKITFPEGFNISMMTDKLKTEFSEFDDGQFILLTKDKEGFLFPDTYFFLPTVSAEDVVFKLEETFWQRTGEKFGWNKENKDKLYDNVILASIIEEEVREFEDKKIVADIFMRRMKIGMPLQADSTLAYITGRDSLSLTVDDLKSKSPYNSYTNRGLPPTPISNPGLESIEAVLFPTPNKYLYFLTDKEGKVYYAETFEEHKRNKMEHLR